MQLASVSIRAGIPEEIAHRCLIQCCFSKCEPPPWAKVVKVDGREYIVGSSTGERYVVFEFPFPGHSDAWKIIPPLNSAEDLLNLLKKPER